MRLTLSVKTVGTAAALFAQLVTSAHNVIDLSKQKWTLTSPNFNNISVPGKVPSHAHVDLYAANIIDDPYVPIDRFTRAKAVPVTNTTTLAA